MQSNPFDMSNMGLNQDNPLFTSMNMMRQMWESMATSPLGASSTSTAIPTAEDLDKRIKELRAVENWLRLNLSMLTSTIQGLEIQRSTLSTFQSFAQSGMAAMPDLAETMAATSDKKSAENKSTSASTSTDETSEGLMQAGQAWWGMMQQQFDTIAQATAQSMQQAQSASENVSASVPNPSADTTFGKTAAAKKTTAKKASKKAAKKTTKTPTPPTE